MKILFPKTIGTICARLSRGFNGQDAYNDVLIVEDTSSNNVSVNMHAGGGVSSTLMARDYKSASDLIVEPSRKRVRRLTPIECLRLQGLPDWWCDEVKGSDSAIYKMAGNGIAVPCAIDVLGRIADEAEDL